MSDKISGQSAHPKPKENLDSKQDTGISKQDWDKEPEMNLTSSQVKNDESELSNESTIKKDEDTSNSSAPPLSPIQSATYDNSETEDRRPENTGGAPETQEQSEENITEDTQKHDNITETNLPGSENNEDFTFDSENLTVGEGVEKELIVEDNDKTPDQDMLSGAFDFFSAPRRTDDKITRFLIKKAGWHDRQTTLVPEVENWTTPPESAEIIRGLWSGVDEDLFKILEQNNWTILPFRSVMVWDLENDIPPRALKEDLKLLWTRKWDGSVKHTQYKHDPNTQPEWENIKICNASEEALSETVLVKRPGVHWIFGLTPNNPESQESKIAQRMALAHAMKDARTHKYLVVINTENPETKLQKGARWGTEWLALKGKLGFWDKVAIAWIKSRIKKDKKSRKKLFDEHSPYA